MTDERRDLIGAAPITRYRQQPPELDALLVTASSADFAIGWLRHHGRDAYVMTANLRVVDGADGALGFDVPFGHYLVVDVRLGRWAPVPPDQLDREYAPVRDPRPWQQRYGAGRGPAGGT